MRIWAQYGKEEKLRLPINWIKLWKNYKLYEISKLRSEEHE